MVLHRLIEVALHRLIAGGHIRIQVLHLNFGYYLYLPLYLYILNHKCKTSIFTV